MGYLNWDISVQDHFADGFVRAVDANVTAALRFYAENHCVPMVESAVAGVVEPWLTMREADNKGGQHEVIVRGPSATLRELVGQAVDMYGRAEAEHQPFLTGWETELLHCLALVQSTLKSD